jgi:hypothetical protein
VKVGNGPSLVNEDETVKEPRRVRVSLRIKLLLNELATPHPRVLMCACSREQPSSGFPG